MTLFYLCYFFKLKYWKCNVNWNTFMLIVIEYVYVNVNWNTFMGHTRVHTRTQSILSERGCNLPKKTFFSKRFPSKEEEEYLFTVLFICILKTGSSKHCCHKFASKVASFYNESIQKLVSPAIINTPTMMATMLKKI